MSSDLYDNFCRLKLASIEMQLKLGQEEGGVFISISFTNLRILY